MKTAGLLSNPDNLITCRIGDVNPKLGRKNKDIAGMAFGLERCRFLRSSGPGRIPCKCSEAGVVTRFISIKSRSGKPCTIKCDLKGTIKLLASMNLKMQRRGELITLTLPKGEETILYTGIKPVPFEVAQFPKTAEKCNSWGIIEK